jgi:hypothetical protein
VIRECEKATFIQQDEGDADDISQDSQHRKNRPVLSVEANE